ncbi:hypothetical protein C2E23DRAFT_834313 [Lenzites betulinus]|nr:hypothetical protein C2E23DRAFT_834313 [Lenzites betulinus]
MGRWTLEHHDEVLRNKIKNMAQGAIRRMESEEDKALITYETFVEELDEGDSFTASLFDILVKEIADRRTRPHADDRRLISERTAKAFYQQSTGARVYRGNQSGIRNWPGRRNIPLPASRSSMSHDMIFADSDGEEDYGTALNTTGPAEGARINTDLHDAYFTSTPNLPGSLSRTTAGVEPAQPTSSPSVVSPEQVDTNPVGRISRPHSPPMGQSTWSTGAESSGSSLTRQPSLRRTFRARRAEFSDFTSRRRSIIRDGDDGPRTNSADGESSVDVLENLRSNIRRRSRPSAGPSSGSDAVNTETPATINPIAGGTRDPAPTSSQVWFSLATPPGPPPIPRLPGVVEPSTEPSPVSPRLRRGGLRPPQLTRHSVLPLTAAVTRRTSQLRMLTSHIPEPVHTDPFRRPDPVHYGVEWITIPEDR